MKVKMDIRERLTAGQSKKSTNEIVAFIGDDPRKFRELLQIFIEGPYRITQRAAWPLSDVACLHPELLEPHAQALFRVLTEDGHHPAVARNVLRIFQTAVIPDDLKGSLLDYCLSAMRSESQPVAVRAFAITVASRICAEYPELKDELMATLSDIALVPQTPAITHRIKMARKSLNAVQS